MKKIFSIILCLCLCFVLYACKNDKDTSVDNKDVQTENEDENSEVILAQKQEISDICENYYSTMYYQNGEEFLEYILPESNKYEQMRTFDKLEEFKKVFYDTFEYVDYVDDNKIENLVLIAGSATSFEIKDILVKKDTAKVDIDILYVNPSTVNNLDDEDAITEFLELKGTDYETYALKIAGMDKTSEEYKLEKETFYNEYGEFLMIKALENVQNGSLSKKTVTENLVKVDGKWYIT